MDESAVMLFLCDEQRGNLTEEQRTFAKEKKAEVHSSFSLSVFELILYQVMYSLHLVSGPEDFAAVFSKSALVCASDKNSDSNCDGAR